jgi:hypothetical protein
MDLLDAHRKYRHACNYDKHFKWVTKQKEHKFFHFLSCVKVCLAYYRILRGTVANILFCRSLLGM